MNKSFIRTNNYNRIVAAVDALCKRDSSLPGLGLFYGNWGYGKTEAVEHFYGQSQTFYMRAQESWNTRRYLEEMCAVMKVSPNNYRLDRLADQVISGMRRWKRPFFIDEADYLFHNKGRMLNIVRDIHDLSRVPVILIGMEEICERLQRYGQFFSRILPAGIVEFTPISPPEIIMVTKEWTGLSIGMEAAEIFCRYVQGDFRYVVGYLLTIEEACKTNNNTAVSAKLVETVVNKAEKLTKRLYGIEEHKEIRVLGKTLQK